MQVADAVLEQVGEPGGAVAKQLERVRLVGVLGQDHHAHLWVAGLDGVCRVDAFHGRRAATLARGTRRGHPDVGEDGLRAGPPYRVEQLRAEPTAASTATSPVSS